MSLGRKRSSTSSQIRVKPQPGRWLKLAKSGHLQRIGCPQKDDRIHHEVIESGVSGMPYLPHEDERPDNQAAVYN